jgi:hypothetical protein
MASNAAEEHFETYLDAHRLTYEYELAAGDAHPDYWVDHDDGLVVCEVRHVTASIGQEVGNGFGSFDAYQPLNRAVKRKSKQGRALEGVWPYVVVLWAPDWGVGDLAVSGALFGKVQISMPMDTTTGTADMDQARSTFGRNAALHHGDDGRPHVTAVALIRRFNPTLRDAEDEISAKLDEVGRDSIDTSLPIISEVFERRAAEGLFDENARQPRLTVFHNPHATISLPAGVFRGPFDQHWFDHDSQYGPWWNGTMLDRLPR